MTRHHRQAKDIVNQDLQEEKALTEIRPFEVSMDVNPVRNRIDAYYQQLDLDQLKKVNAHEIGKLKDMNRYIGNNLAQPFVSMPLGLQPVEEDALVLKQQGHLSRMAALDLLRERLNQKKLDTTQGQGSKLINL